MGGLSHEEFMRVLHNPFLVVLVSKILILTQLKKLARIFNYNFLRFITALNFLHAFVSRMWANQAKFVCMFVLV